MEELRTTEILEREILEDARKKAARLLKTADDSLAQQKRNWEKKIADDIESIRKAYMNRMKKTIEDIFARLPLDKRRLRLKTHEEFLSAAIEDFLSGLEHERTISLLERELLRLLETINVEAAASAVTVEGGVANDAVKAAVVRYSGITLTEARSILKKSPAAFDWQFQDDFAANDSPDNTPGANSRFPIMVIDTDAFRLTASVEAAAAALLKDEREELAAALLGREALYD